MKKTFTPSVGQTRDLWFRPPQDIKDEASARKSVDWFTTPPPDEKIAQQMVPSPPQKYEADPLSRDIEYLEAQLRE